MYNGQFFMDENGLIAFNHYNVLIFPWSDCDVLMNNATNVVINIATLDCPSYVAISLYKNNRETSDYLFTNLESLIFKFWKNRNNLYKEIVFFDFSPRDEKNIKEYLRELCSINDPFR